MIDCPSYTLSKGVTSRSPYGRFVLYHAIHLTLMEVGDFSKIQTELLLLSLILRFASHSCGHILPEILILLYVSADQLGDSK